MFPLSSFTLYLQEARIPCATLDLPEEPEHSVTINGRAYITAAIPARTVPVILPLYHAHAYPEHYYTAGQNLTPIKSLAVYL